MQVFSDRVHIAGIIELGQRPDAVPEIVADLLRTLHVPLLRGKLHLLHLEKPVALFRIRNAQKAGDDEIEDDLHEQPQEQQCDQDELQI